MENVKKDANVIEFFLLAMAFLSIAAIQITVNQMIAESFGGRARYVLFAIILFFFLNKKYKLHVEAKTYVIALTIGFILHRISDISMEENLSNALISRLLPVFLMSMYLRVEKNMRWVMLFMMAFYIIECLMCFYERMTLTHFFSYTYRGVEDGFNMAMAEDDEDIYRANALMAHPLFNANTISVAMAFILCSDKINFLIKYPLLFLGLIGLFGCNSRGAFIVWGVIIIFRLVLFSKRWWHGLIVIVILYFAIPVFLDWLLHSGLLGRMDGFDFSDDSTNTRLIAFAVFASERWNLQDIIVGGRLITYWASEITLENGILLDLCYWGWIIGPIKICTEVFLSWRACHNFPIKAKIIIMLATWGVAFMNNNSQQNWLLPMFVLFCIGFAQFQSKEPQTIEKPGDISRDDSNGLGGRKRRYTPDDIVKLRRQIMKGKIKRR